ncbi:MAG: hypothetical protein E2581_08925 [Pseudomonas sp.]|uniref:phage tail assembly chaperone n=1 Tax=Pseudomonas sp. TaxID=306 RepID=UPI001E1953AD|nr:phage tail assembly chaperone [Pseudomonas sp.]MPS98609.1 hypothetical protein [Pseudomonas sp.]
MAKIKSLVGAPPEFHLPIALKDLDGSDAEVIFKCVGRTLRDWHPLAIKRITDDANAMLEVEEAREALEAKSDEPAAAAPKRKTKATRFEISDEDLQQSIDKGLVQTTEIIREVATGWDLDDEFTDANIALLCSRFPGVHQKLWQAYDARIRGDRLGN